MKKLFIVIMTGLFLWSCNNNSTGIELNDGKKWEVNQEMKPFVKNSSELVTNYINNKDNDFKTLASELKNQNESLIKSCTMQGKSHDELHKWLHPNLEMVTALEKAADSKQAETIVKQLQESYQEYSNYFQ